MNPLSYIWLDSTPLVRVALQLDKARATAPCWIPSTAWWPPAVLHVQRVAVQIGDQAPAWMTYPDHPENSKTWERTVVTNRMTATLAVTLPAGPTRLRITATEPTLVLTGADLMP